jgi:hypothetical protein
VELGVGREDGESAALGHGTDQEVGVGSLHPASPAKIEEFRGPLMILRGHLEIREGAQVSAQLLELCRVTKTREDLLPDRSQEAGLHLLDQPDKLASCRMNDFALPPTQRQGPDAGVDQDAQGRFLCFL